MKRKTTIIGMLVMVLSLVFPLSAMAQEEAPGEPIRLAGEISEIQGTTIVVNTFQGEEQRVRISEDTHFRSPGGEIQSLDDLEIGMKVAVIGSLKGEIVFARLIAAGRFDWLNRPHRFRGEVISVSVSDQNFTLQNREGNQTTFTVTEETKYHSREDELSSIEDISVGQHLAVIFGKADPDIALHVLLLPERDEDRPKLDQRVRGELTAISDNRLEVETRQGEQVVFQITENTKIRKMGGGELAIGDRVAVVGFEDEGGSNVAVLVVARPPRDRSGFSGDEFRLQPAPDRQPATPGSPES